MKTVRKAVFPVAGMGTRFLPATKAMPKEMLPVVDKPLIQYAVEEAVAAGITDLIFVTGRNKRAIEDHFDAAPELETDLEKKGKNELLALVRDILPPHVNCIYIRQSAPLGLGHAVLTAAPAVGDEPFAVLLADDLIDADTPVLSQLIACAAEHEGSVLGVQEVPREDTRKYGIVAATEVAPRTERVSHMVEKPAPEQAPSTLAVVGRYVLEPEIFDHLRATQMDKSNEIQLTDGIAAMMRDRPVFAYRYEGRRFDCGSKAGMFQATVAFGRKYHGLIPD
ncbi:UTP--glucose-1-phosphate uridylyltransferase GalU [Bordetella pseudohinzii]|uniref:UTP--glucose-1-phosphate uridylyltransferase n=1 Tax=Bordetella pseudohinzii TaxID=1331258 RepID=A0A0J6BV10_9BORD|nr:UTP--glucose-1-phosphate uridylyltransferase GalU [Bordetella pseudohinzii]ANY17421.1 UTP--glucose-1-phosphate uridylyltransferase [Bordetella pseudohinzii]KMM25639.1 UTP--glucose-1-phosphate uridylyltransferase [Bordetella pseudohinzii]KXA81637.1 UTP--glucose-1-phosphate uridylyltransferase [Bordetella pseudohinzii]KXA83122.1 UTP--glucose-1-phosphate uridylyltransferase [Bordetella pseudohinzii]CUI70725.1 UTP--glucose-1-phosphate uridylyltransferase [Bordetella pseudohinzii]